MPNSRVHQNDYLDGLKHAIIRGMNRINCLKTNIHNPRNEALEYTVLKYPVFTHATQCYA